MEDKILKNVVLLVVVVGSFLIPFMGSSLSVALPTIQKEFLISLVLLSWIPTAFVLANAAFILPFGRLADIYGRKKIFTYGVLIYTLASLLAAISPSGIILLLFSFLQGLGCSMIFATAVALLSSVFPIGRRGLAIGIYVTAVYIGLFLGPLLGGFLTQNFGWRSIFLFNVIIGLLLIILILLKLKKEWKDSENAKFDSIGSLIFIITILATLSGLTIINQDLGKYLILIGITGIILFIRYEKHSESPILDISIFKKRLSAFSSIAMLFMNIATSGMWILLSLYLQYLKLLKPDMVGLILVIQPLTVSIISPFVGRFSDKNKTTKIPALGMIITTFGLILFSFLSFKTSLNYIIIGLLLIGSGLGLFSSPTTNNYMNSVNKKIYGVASATFSTMIYSGQSISLAIVIIIFATYLGNITINPQYYPIFLKSVNTTFLIFSIVCFIGIFFSYFSNKGKN
jgi:EmrB/QacA subfamily drug resistance transporter